MIPLKPIEEIEAEFDIALGQLASDSSLTRIVETGRKGVPNIHKLFSMDSATLRNALKETIGDKLPNHFLDNAKIIKKIENDEATSIEMWWYDMMEITLTCITFKPEHGSNQHIIDTHFLKL